MKSFLVTGYRFIDHAGCDFALLPTHDLDPPPFQILVDMEEMLHFLQIMLRKISYVEVLVVVRVMTRHRQNFVIWLTSIEHLQNTQWSAVDLAAGKCRLGDVDEDIERVAILVQRARDESIISRIMNSGIEHAVEANHAGGLVQLVFVAASGWYLDHGRHVVRRMNPGWQIMPRIDHVVTRSIVPLYLIGSSSTPKLRSASSVTRSSCAVIRSGLSEASANSRS